MGVDSPVEAEPHLRAVLETQPVVLTRVSKEGTFLAINESGLSMLGAQSLEQVLGTSLLNMVSGFYRPDTGRIALEGHDITSLRPSQVAARGIARTFQNIALFSGLTVLDNLMLGRHVHMHNLKTKRW